MKITEEKANLNCCLHRLLRFKFNKAKAQFIILQQQSKSVRKYIKAGNLEPKPTVTNLTVPNLDAIWFDCTKFFKLFPNHFNR